jgi:hypothetical protein
MTAALRRLLRPFLQIVVQHARGGRIAPPLGKSDHLQNPHRAIEADGDDVAGLDGMTRRLLSRPVDADVAGLDQRSGAAAGPDHPRVPQPFVETLALQATPLLFPLAPLAGRGSG